MPSLSVVAVANTSFGTSHNRSVTAPAANEVLVLYLANNTGSTINSSLTDSGGGTWTFDVGTATNFGFYRRSGGSTSGSITVSWTTSSGDVCWGAAFYLSGVATTSPVDATSAFSTFGFTTTPSVSITTNSSNCLVLAQIYKAGGATPTLTPTAPAQLYQDATYTSTHHLYLTDAGAAGAKTLAGTWADGAGGERFAVAYKAATASGPSRPTSDITTTGWSASTGVVLFDMIDEASAADGDYIISPELGGSPGPAVFALTPTLAAGNHQIDVRARRTSTAGQVRVILQDSGGTAVGTSAWQSLTASFATYTLGVTTTGTAERVSIEVSA